MGHGLGHNHRETWVQVLKHARHQEQRQGTPLHYLSRRTTEKAEGIAGSMLRSGASQELEGKLRVAWRGADLHPQQEKTICMLALQTG